VFRLEKPKVKKKAVLVGTAVSTLNVSLSTLHVLGVGMLTLHAETPVIGVRYIKTRRSRWSRGLRYRPVTARLLQSRVRIRQG